MRILALGDPLNNPRIRQAAADAGLDFVYVSSRQFRLAPLNQDFDVLLASADHGDHLDLKGTPILNRCRIIVPLSGENIAAGISALPQPEIETLNAYFAYGGPENLRNGFARILQLLHGETVSLSPPLILPLDAIYSFEGGYFSDPDSFFAAQKQTFPVYVGMMSYRSRWADGDIAAETSIAEQLAQLNIGVIPAYTDGSPNAELGTLSFQEAVRRFFCSNGKPVIDLLINFQFFGTKAGNGQDMFAQAADCYAELDLPIIRPTGLTRSSQEQWLTETHPYASDLPTNFIVPELQGMIEPIHISCADSMHCRQPIPERVQRLCGRIHNWLKLRQKPNRDKRVAIFLHNAPCSGVEATVGLASDLDAFQSAVDILHRLSQEGYTVTNIPENGLDLKEQIFTKKAVSDFRWTAAEDIAACGGALYQMDTSEYLRYYNQLSENAKAQMEQSWGTPPGQAMVLKQKILITGLSFGNVLVMVQPKRGCYGSKCTGEVCKILQDPSCPPSHQFLATYWFLSSNWQADALIHLGTHGSLEYLPGKSAGLSQDCFPDIALGNLINLYPYNVSTVPQALIARRRSYATTLSYLPAPGRGLAPEQRQMAELIRQYYNAKEQQTDQIDALRNQIDHLVPTSPAAQAVFAREADWDNALLELRAMLSKTQNNRQGSYLRSLGSIPERSWMQDYLIELWCADPVFCSYFQESDSSSPSIDAMTNWIDQVLDAPESNTDPALQPLLEDTQAVIQALCRADEEMEQLLHALSGGFIRPSRGGDAASAGRAILPPGRNLHGGEQDKVPTPLAYARGKEAAENLLEVYRRDSAALPEKIAMNMTSMDITRTGGEQLGQFLYLLGISPIWNPDGRVDGLRCLTLEELQRPRLDVTVHISSVMRDAWPDILTLMDRAVRLAAEQDESDEDNYVRANSRRIGQSGEDSTGRIFGGQPGTYTSAVGLALKASAWKNEEDLARYFIDSSSYLYGENRQGIHSPGAFAANIRQVDLTCDITSSRRTDGIASSYSARIQGSFRLAAKSLGSRKNIRQYMGESKTGTGIRVVPMDEHIATSIQDTLLNDIWREQMMQDGYQGAAELMDRMQNLFDTQCVCENIAAETLDQIADRYLLNPEMQNWFRETNPYALEESSRRFLELNTRGKWNGDTQILQKLRRAYLQAEGDLEEQISGLGEIQAGNVDIITHDQVESWAKRLSETEKIVQKWNKSNL